MARPAARRRAQAGEPAHRAVRGVRPWYLGALEPDFLAGRRGVLGWAWPLDYDPGLLVAGREADMSWWDSVRARWADDPWTTVAYVGAGALLIAGGVVVTVLTAGLGAGALVPALTMGGALIFAGAGVAAAGAATHDLGAATQAGFAGAAMGAAAGLTFGASFALSPAMAVGGTALFAGGLGAYEYGGYRREAYGQDDLWGRGLQAFGKAGMTVGAIMVATPLVSAVLSGLVSGATAVSPILGIGVKLGLVALGGYGLYREGRAMYRDWRDPTVDWIEWVDRHGASAAFMAYAAGRAGIGAGRALWRNRLIFRHPLRWHEEMKFKYRWNSRPWEPPGARRRLGDEGWAQPEQHVHHRFIKQRTWLEQTFPYIINRKWNLLPIPPEGATIGGRFFTPGRLHKALDRRSISFANRFIQARMDEPIIQMSRSLYLREIALIGLLED